MPRTPDRRPGPLEELEEFRLLTPAGSVPSVIGGMVYDPGIGSFVFRDATGDFDPRTGGGGLTPVSHATLDQLVHDIAESSYFEVSRSAGRVSGVAYYTDATKTTPIRDVTVTRTAGLVSSIVVRQYDGAGSVAETLTGAITRSFGRVTSIVWVLT
jgi:hypothetical protein